MGAGHVLELGDAVMDSASGSAQEEGLSMLSQREESLLAANVLVLSRALSPARDRDSK